MDIITSLIDNIVIKFQIVKTNPNQILILMLRVPHAGPSSPAMLSKGAKKKLAEKRKGGGGESSSSGPLVKKSRVATRPSTESLAGAAPRHSTESPAGAAPRQSTESSTGVVSSPPSRVTSSLPTRVTAVTSTPVTPLPLPALAPSSFAPGTSLNPLASRPTPPVCPSGSTLSIVPEVVPMIKAFQNHLP